MLSPTAVRPMLLHKNNVVPSGAYIHQMKFDGIRGIVHFSNEKLEVFTRHQNNCTAQFPEMQAIRLSDADCILDGEIVVLDQEAKPDFEAVMEKFQARTNLKINQLLHRMPAMFIAFDILYRKGTDVMNKPLKERLEILASVVEPSNAIALCPSYEDGEALFAAVKARGLEGIVSKKLDSKYMLDYRSPNWLKIKNYLFETVFISGIRKKEFGWSLVDGSGRYVGTCEFVPPMERSVFHNISKQLIIGEDKNWTFLEPRIKIDVKFQCWTKKGLMRSPSFVKFCF